MTVCIATCRRPAGLARLLESLERQKLPPGLRVELVAVDNDPARSAAELLAAASRRLPLRAACEPRRNIALARNRAVALARGSWLAFIDDDEVASEDWLASYWECVSRLEGDGWFGPVLPRLEDGVVEGWLAVERFHGRPRHPTGARLAVSELRTSNALLRRGLFDRYRFDPAYGLSGGSDSECLGRMLAGGAELRWCDEAAVVEVIPAERHRLAWLSRRAFRGGVVSTRIARSRGARPGGPAGALRAILATVALVGALPLAALAGRTAAARAWLRLCVQAGHLWAFAGRSFEEYGRCG